MEAKLKQLKVPQLKEILTEAKVPFILRETKSDLIAKILGNAEALRIAGGGDKQAVETSASKAPTDDDLLAPPEDLEWEPPSVTKPTTSAPPVHEVKPSSATQPPAQVPAAAAIAETPASTAAVTENAEDPELDKRRQRAARFGIEYVEPKPKKAPKEKKTVDDPNKLKSRAERFGIPSVGTETKGKRARSPAPVDAEEAEKRRKRAERFGMVVTANAAGA